MTNGIDANYTNRESFIYVKLSYIELENIKSNGVSDWLLCSLSLPTVSSDECWRKEF